MDFNIPPDYYAQAEKCMEWAGRAADRETELHWLSMAQAYLSLAVALEKEVWEGALHYPVDLSNPLTKH